eukprot:NODE_694_length_5096_cov_0.086652.p1 type:complete len:953 gc:universal NODE_694_length_5096_cov_0.086652:4850-1992(-)
MEFQTSSQSQNVPRDSTFSLFNTNRKGKILKDYHANDENEISVEQDDVVTILFMEEVKDITKSSKVLVEHHGVLGWMPCSNLILEEDDKKESTVERQESIKISQISPPATSNNSINQSNSVASSASNTQKKDKKKSSSVPIIGNPVAPLVKTPSVTSPTKISSDAPQNKSWVDFIGRDTVPGLKLSKMEIKRQEAIYEMLLTEQDYVRDLEMIIQLYIKPLRKSKVISAKDLGIIFSVWEQLVPVNSELLKKLDEKHLLNPIVEEIGDIWSNITDYMKVYTMYCSNHPYALMRLEKCNNIKAFNKFAMQTQQLPECRSLPLSSYLLKPVQRICKYPLLIREIMRNTPEGHKDYQNLQQGLIKVETLVTIVNDHAKQTDMVQKMMKIQASFNGKITIVSPSRILVSEKQVNQVVINNDDKTISRRARTLFIFNDMLVLGKEERLQIGELRLKLIASFQFDKLLVSQCAQGEYGHENCMVLSRKDADDSFLIQCKNSDERNKIVKSLKGLINDHLKTYFRMAQPLVKEQKTVEKPKQNRKSLLDEVQIPEVDNLFIFEEHLQDVNDMYKSEEGDTQDVQEMIPVIHFDDTEAHNFDAKIEDSDTASISTTSLDASSNSDSEDVVDVAAKMLAQHTAMSETFALEMLQQSQQSPQSNRNSRLFKIPIDVTKLDKSLIESTTESSHDEKLQQQTRRIRNSEIAASEVLAANIRASSTIVDSNSSSEPARNSIIEVTKNKLKEPQWDIKDPRSLTIHRMANSGAVRQLSAEMFTPPAKIPPAIPAKHFTTTINNNTPPPIPAKSAHILSSPNTSVASTLYSKESKSPAASKLTPNTAVPSSITGINTVTTQIVGNSPSSLNTKSNPNTLSTTSESLKRISESFEKRLSETSEKRIDEKRIVIPSNSTPELVEQLIEIISHSIIDKRILPVINKAAKSAKISAVYKVEEGKREYVFQC